MSIWLYLLSFGVSAAISLVLTWGLVRLSERMPLFVDRPDERRLHTKPVARCGGVAVFAATIGAALLVFQIPTFGSMHTQVGPDNFALFANVGGWLLLVGLVDDGWGLRWHLKLAAQVCAAMVMLLGGFSMESIGGIGLAPWLDIILTVAWYLVFINAMNLIDGLDGLAAGLAISGALGLAVLCLFNRSPGDSILLVGFIGACAGFLYFNFHPARIFLGDSGSMFLGFTLATFGLAIGAKTTTVTAFIAPLIAVGVPFFDALLAVWRRSARAILGRILETGHRVSIAHADMDHLHHRLVKIGLSQRRVALLLYAASLSLVGVGLLSVSFHERAGAIILLAFIAGTYVVVRHICHTELWDSGALVTAGFRQPKSTVVATIVLPLIDIVVLSLSLAFADFLLFPAASFGEFKVRLFAEMPVWVGIPFIALAASRTYSRVWSRARISEFVFFAAVFLGSCAVAFAVVNLGGVGSVRAEFVHGLIYSGVSCFLLLGARAFPRAMHDALAFVRRAESAHGHDRVLVYGAGSRCQLYMRRRLVGLFERQRSEQIVGLIDDDPNLRKRLVLGYRVLGVGAELPRLARELGVTKVVLLCSLQAGAEAELAALCRERGIGLVIWRVDEVSVVGDSSAASPERDALRQAGRRL